MIDIKVYILLYLMAVLQVFCDPKERGEVNIWAKIIVANIYATLILIITYYLPRFLIYIGG